MKYSWLSLSVLLILSGCNSRAASDGTAFNRVTVDPSRAGVVAAGDIDGDGVADLFAARGDGGELTWIAWYQADPCDGSWSRHIVDGVANFRGDDIDLADIDGDGDLDGIVSVDDDGKVYWYENPRCGTGGWTGNPATDTWVGHRVGTTEISGDYVKDTEVADLDLDGDPDVVTRTRTVLSIWLQNGPDAWTLVEIPDIPEREGMDVGDIDGNGYPDIVLNGYWYEAPSGGADPADPASWLRHTIDAKWYTNTDESNVWRANSCKVCVADVDGNGKKDVLLSHSEMSAPDFPPGEWDYPITWYGADDPENNPDVWTGHVVSNAGHVHTLQAADMDLDGDLDVVAARFQRDAPPESVAPWPVAVLLNSGTGTAWSPMIISNDGMYGGIVADVGGDGDFDLIGSRSYWLQPIEIWENQLRPRPVGVDDWTYIEVDGSRDAQYFGLAMGDLDHDGDIDIVSGKYFYRNPGLGMTAAWPRAELPAADAHWVVDVDGDANGDVIAYNDTGLHWLEATDPEATGWTSRRVGPGFGADHGISTQGAILADLVSTSPKPEIVFSAGVDSGFVAGLVYFEIPPDPNAPGDWPNTVITTDNVQEGIAAADFDRDGRIDVAGKLAFVNEGRRVAWWKNPGDGSGNWERRDVGDTENWADRIAAADINRDGRPDLVVTEEKWTPPEEPPATGLGTYWFEQLPSAGGPFGTGDWSRHTIALQHTTNSMDVGDVDHDGDVDVVTGEHKGTKNVIIWENENCDGSAWTPHPVATGMESHLGTRLVDLDGDGDLDLVSTAWDEYWYLHVWRNDSRDAAPAGAANWEAY